MTYAPASLVELAKYWVAQGGVNLGIKGDADHVDRGVSYHLGRDQLLPGAYSAQRPRDRAGLSDAASAIDLGKLDGSYAQLRAFSDWLARRCVNGDHGTFDVVEVIYSPDGRRVLGFKDGVDHLIPDYGNLGHLTHTHISFYRDSEARDKVALFRPYFEEIPMNVDFTIRGDVPPGSVRTTSPTSAVQIMKDGHAVVVGAGREFRVYATIRRTDGKDGYLIGIPNPGVIDPGFILLGDADLVAGPPAGDVKHKVSLVIDDDPAYETTV